MKVFCLYRELEPGQQLAGKDQSAVHYTKQQRVAVFKAAGNVVGQVTDGSLYLLFINQAISFGHNLIHFGDGIGHNGRSCRKTGDYTGEGKRRGGGARRTIGRKSQVGASSPALVNPDVPGIMTLQRS